MSPRLENLKIAILAADGFEQVELTEPRKALDEAGAQTLLVSPKDGQVQGWKHHDKADSFKVDVPLSQAKAEDFDGLLLPGGVVNPDALRLEPEAIAFVKAFADAGKPIAAICHGLWTLINAGAVEGKRLTSWPSLEADLRNAGADWVDQESVTDNNIVTARKPDDIPAFNAAMIERFAQTAKVAA